MGTAPIIRAASVFTCWLPLWMQGVDIHRKMQFAPYHLLVLSGEFVSAVYAFGMPVSPIQTIFKHSDCKWVRETLADHSFAIGSVQIGSLNNVVFSIHPVHTSSSIINSQSIGPEEMCICNDTSVGTIHARIFNTWCITPICPVDGAFHWVQSYGSRLLQVFPQNYSAMGPV